MWILIPAFEPDRSLVELVRSLRPVFPVAVVDDGSGPRFDRLFDKCDDAGAVVLRHELNRGKGAAFRTGFAWLEDHAPGESVVCADSDGQHRPADIARVAAEVARRRHAGLPDAIVLGARAFAGDVPMRSRLGNRVTAALVAAASGRRFADTQTGLRAYPASLLPWARAVPGERFAYELQVLLSAAREGVPVAEVPIATVYLDRTASSHFRPLVDSVRVLWPLAAFAASSLVAFALDTVALLALSALTGSLAVAVGGARAISGTANFLLNRHAVFGSRDRAVPQALSYWALALGLAALNYLSLRLLTDLDVPLLAAKVATDVTLWTMSYGVQRAVVFPPTTTTAAGMPMVRGADVTR